MNQEIQRCRKIVKIHHACERYFENPSKWLPCVSAFLPGWKQFDLLLLLRGFSRTRLMLLLLLSLLHSLLRSSRNQRSHNLSTLPTQLLSRLSKFLANLASMDQLHHSSLAGFLLIATDSDFVRVIRARWRVSGWPNPNNVFPVAHAYEAPLLSASAV